MLVQNKYEKNIFLGNKRNIFHTAIKNRVDTKRMQNGTIKFSMMLIFGLSFSFYGIILEI